MKGPGTCLKEVLEGIPLFHFKPCSKCKAFMRRMNREGLQWSKDNVPLILLRMKQATKERKLPFSKWIARRIIFKAFRMAEQEIKGQQMNKNQLKKYFEEVHCVTLARRPDRWETFLKNVGPDWPFATIQKFDAIDGKLCKHPDGWRQGGGAWGCYRSHLRILEDALNRGVDSVLFLEDDAKPCEDFFQKTKAFLEAVPKDWGMIYLGGQHLFVNKNPPLEVNPLVFRPYNVNRTHGFALRGDMMRIVYKHLNRLDWTAGHHIDHHLGRLHQRREHPIYCPGDWLLGQAEGKSDISGRTPPDRFWKGASTIAEIDPTTLPFIAVIGLHSSGSSCLAGTLHHLGCHLGNQLVGYYGKDPDKLCGFEAVGLANLCERAIKFPEAKLKMKRGGIYHALKAFINQKRREAANMETLAAGKYPHLCRMGNQLLNICGNNLRVIFIDRPIEDSIRSLQRRCPDKDAEAIDLHQRWLDAGKEFIRGELDDTLQLSVAYYDLLENPEKEIQRMVDFLKIQPSKEAFKRAVEYVQPSEQHVGK